jgi:hypothetical protein
MSEFIDAVSTTNLASTKLVVPNTDRGGGKLCFINLRQQVKVANKNKLKNNYKLTDFLNP